jgi:hypothetical protein
MKLEECDPAFKLSLFSSESDPSYCGERITIIYPIGAT